MFLKSLQSLKTEFTSFVRRIAMEMVWKMSEVLLIA